MEAFVSTEYRETFIEIYEHDPDKCLVTFIEVLSPSNVRKLIDIKLRLYCQAPDNLYALVIDPRKFWVEVYAKTRKWDPVILKHPDDAIEMPEFGLQCRVADLYRSTELDPEWV